MYAPYKKHASNVRYWVNYVRCCSCLASDMQEKQTELESENT